MEQLYNERRKLFKDYYYWSLKNYDCDPALFLMNYVFKRMELNIEQRYWICWLYGNTYNLPTAWIIANEFPDYENVDLERLTQWNNENYKRLRYQNDNKWQKGHLPKMFESYRSAIKEAGFNTQQGYFESLCTDTVEENYLNVKIAVINNFYKFGRYLCWFYMQTLAECCDLPLQPNNLLLNDDSSRSHCKGLMYAIGKEEWGVDKKFKLSFEQHYILDEEANNLLFEMQYEHSDVKADFFTMETCLCAFKKIFRQRDGRYLGYYLDRQAEDIFRCQQDGWTGIDWDLLWQGRQEILDKRLLNMYVDKNKFGEYIINGTIQKLDWYA